MPLLPLLLLSSASIEDIEVLHLQRHKDIIVISISLPFLYVVFVWGPLCFRIIPHLIELPTPRTKHFDSIMCHQVLCQVGADTPGQRRPEPQNLQVNERSKKQIVTAKSAPGFEKAYFLSFVSGLLPFLWFMHWDQSAFDEDYPFFPSLGRALGFVALISPFWDLYARRRAAKKSSKGAQAKEDELKKKEKKQKESKHKDNKENKENREKKEKKEKDKKEHKGKREKNKAGSFAYTCTFCWM